MLFAIILGSFISLAGGALLLRVKKHRQIALLLTLPFGAGALLAAAFFDLLPEAFELAEPRAILLYCLAGFIFFFLLERSASWFHHHHEHEIQAKNTRQRWLVVLGDFMHNAIDGVAIGAAFSVDPATGIITTLAVAAHEVPKELGTFALLLSKGWSGKIVILANLGTAVATVLTAMAAYSLGHDLEGFEAVMLALTAGFFIYVAASDIIPDIHEQPQKIGMIQAAMLLVGVVLVGCVITLLGV